MKRSDDEIYRKLRLEKFRGELVDSIRDIMDDEEIAYSDVSDVLMAIVSIIDPADGV